MLQEKNRIYSAIQTSQRAGGRLGEMSTYVGSMETWLTTLIRPLVAAALLGATLSGLGSLGWFFWQNREVCPCAPVGLETSGLTVAVPLTPRVQQNILKATGYGAVIGIVFAAMWVVPPTLRLRRLLRDEASEV